MTRTRWMNTDGDRILLLSLSSHTINDLLEKDVRLLYKVKKCNAWEYFVYKYFRINLKAKDKFKWLKFSIKTGWGRSFVGILLRHYLKWTNNL